MVGRDVAEVDLRLAAGDLACGGCGGRLCRWGWAREREVRGLGRLRPRRARCVVCLVTHVLLPVSCLLRRADGVEVIGAGLVLKAAGRGHRPVAAVLSVPAATVRRWFAAFAAASAALTSLLALVAAELDPLHGPMPVHAGGGVVADAVELVGGVGAAARRRLGVLGAVSAWELVAAVTGGRLLAPAPRDWTREWINTSWVLEGS